ncbi:MAG TPA: aminotransferase class I/II-fold pyridoxal phosphate-dependent enzyme [Polyangiaceae bacterium]|nr:aminotransferase class I/II-fold pyridoxal phosphate-dependent enzyme [Polyangiaceae bacterium]
MDRWAEQTLDELRSSGLFRDPVDSALHQHEAPGGGPWVDACSNDYLGLAARLVSRETMNGARVGAAASRLVQGTFREHEALEAELANWVGTEACLMLPSAFAANVGLIPVLASDPKSLVVSDALNHASIVDGCRLARGRTVVTPHLSLDAVADALARRDPHAPAWVVTEGLFSMDGDSPDLARLRALCDRYEAGLVVDEAHSLGVLGPGGSGAAAAAGARADVYVAGLGKAIGGQGGMIACSAVMRSLLWNRARSFVFSTGVSPAFASLMLGQVRAAREADAERARLREHAAALRTALSRCPLPASTVPSPTAAAGPIVPVLLGTNERAMLAMDQLRQRGVLAQAIRPPTVPVGQARLRLTAHADWPREAIERIAEGVEAACA